MSSVEKVTEGAPPPEHRGYDASGTEPGAQAVPSQYMTQAELTISVNC